MLQIEQFVKALKDWKNQSEKQIEDILKRIQTLPMPEQQKIIATLKDTLISFHKDINKADEVDEGWFADVLKAKKHVKKLEQDYKKSANKPKLIKKDSSIPFPEELFEDKDQRKKSILKNLYKNFIVNLTEETASKSKLIVIFLHKLLDSLYEIFRLDKKNLQDENLKKLFERLDKISFKFLQSSTTQAKIEMIQGTKQAKFVAQMSPEAFVSEQAKKRREKKEQQLAKRNEIGFYDNMKKAINKDAAQECRKCHKNMAYCEDMKQTRAADEPMTKFMKCNSCGHQWRCE